MPAKMPGLINTIESKPLIPDRLWATLYIARDLIPFIPRDCYSYIDGFGEIGQCSDQRINGMRGIKRDSETGEAESGLIINAGARL